jgi:hypothetical protein
MKKYLIVEDERLAFSELKRMVDRLGRIIIYWEEQKAYWNLSNFYRSKSLILF